MELRDYQERQLRFLKQKYPILSLQSPTGTGKSYVIWQLIKDQFQDEPSSKVIVCTGFNLLIEQLYETAKLFGLNPTVLRGNQRLKPNCETGSTKLEYYRTGDTTISKCSSCPYYKMDYTEDGKFKIIDNRPPNCSKNLISEALQSNLILTNHSYYLTIKDKVEPDLLVIDEAHVFGNFYDSFMQSRLSVRSKMIWKRYLELNSPLLALFYSSVDNYTINNNLINTIVNDVANKVKIENYSDFENFKNEFGCIFGNIDYTSFIENDNGNIIKYNFFHNYDIRAKKIIITSATVDYYTTKMFGVYNKNQMFVQPEPVNRYKDSYYLGVDQDYREWIEENWNSLLRFNRTLILTTTIDDVKFTIQLFKKHGIDVYDDWRQFGDDDSGILVGSRMFFQGLDLHNLDCVLLSRIPFDNYNNKYRAYCSYLEKETKCDIWTDYTMPFVYNMLTQASGRLWRQNDYQNNVFDNGTFIITDKRLGKRFSYINSYIPKTRNGINVIHDLSEIAES